MNPIYLARWGTVLALLLLAACGGGGSGSSGTAPVARVEISPSAALLSGAGQSRQLTAQAYDADGNAVETVVTWTSNRPASVSVDKAGMVTAQTTVGSAQIVAEAGGIRSQPALALVAQPVAGAVLVADEQVVGNAQATDAGASPHPANTWHVTLRGVAPPPVGTLMVGTGAKPTSGRVVAAQASGSSVIVTLRSVPPRELFTNLRMQEVFDLSRAEVRIPEDVAARFDLRREGDRYVFTEKPGARTLGAAPRERALAATGTFALPPFSSCESNFPELAEIDVPDLVPLSLDGPLSFAVTIAPSYEIDYDSATGLNKLLVKAEPTLEMEAALTLAIAAKASYGCKITLFEFVIPFSGPLGWIASGVVPVGVGFELAGELELVSAKVAGKTTAKFAAQVGIHCLGGACGAVASAGNGSLSLEPEYQLPVFNGFRFQPSLSLFAFVKANLGNPVFQSLQFEAFEAKVAGTLQGSFASKPNQIDDAGYRSDYRASLDLEAGAGVGFSGLLGLLGLDDFASIKFSESFPLAASPTGAVVADRAAFVAGDPVNFKVSLATASVDFFSGVGPYNVERVLLLRQIGGSAPVEIGSQIATSGQATFDFTWVATDSGKAGDFHAFVVTKLLPAELLALEIGQASAPAADLGVRLRRSFVVDNTGCRASALSELVANPNEYLYDLDEDSFNEGGPASCSASVIGAAASFSGSGSINGTFYAPSEPNDPGLAVTSIDASGSYQSQTSLTAVASSTRRRAADAFGRANGSASWVLAGGAQPMAYTLTVTLNAQAGSGAGVQLYDPGAPVETQTLVRVAACPGLATSPDNWISDHEGLCISTEDVDTPSKTVSYSGVLGAGQTIAVDIHLSSGWTGTRDVGPEYAQGPSGTRTTSTGFQLTLQFSPL